MKSGEKKREFLKYVYACAIAVVIIASAAIISVTSSSGSANKVVNNDAKIGDEVVDVATKPTYTLPMTGATVIKDYSATELQYNETLKQWQIHKAVDFVAGENSNVYSVSAGTVTKVYNNFLEGNVVEVTHSNGLITVYKSLNEVVVAEGDRLVTGEIIGSVGNTMAEEQTVGAHLHLEMIENGKKIDPNNYLDLGIK